MGMECLVGGLGSGYFGGASSILQSVLVFSVYFIECLLSLEDEKIDYFLDLAFYSTDHLFEVFALIPVGFHRVLLLLESVIVYFLGLFVEEVKEELVFLVVSDHLYIVMFHDG